MGSYSTFGNALNTCCKGCNVLSILLALVFSSGGNYVQFPYTVSNAIDRSRSQADSIRFADSSRVAHIADSCLSCASVDSVNIGIAGTTSGGIVQNSRSLHGNIDSLSLTQIVHSPFTANINKNIGNIVLGEDNVDTVGTWNFVSGIGHRDSGNYNSVVEGNYNGCKGCSQSHIEGHGVTAYSSGTSHLENANNKDSLSTSVHIEGESQHSNSNHYTHLEGYANLGYNSSSAHIEGKLNWLNNGVGTHIEGENNVVKHNDKHIEGVGNVDTSVNPYNHVEGAYNIVNGSATNAHIEGSANYASGNMQYGHIEGTYNKDSSTKTHTEGSNNTVFSGSSYSHVEGFANQLQPNSQYSHVEGYVNIDSNTSESHTEGEQNYLTNALRTHVEGYSNNGRGSSDSHLEGRVHTDSSSDALHLEGILNTAKGTSETHIEGYGNTGKLSNVGHIEGRLNTQRKSQYSHNEGIGNNLDSLSFAAHIEGYYNGSNSYNIHSEGSNNTDSGDYVSHIENFSNASRSDTMSHIEGIRNITLKTTGIHMEGGFNIADSGSRFGHVEGDSNYLSKLNFASHIEGARDSSKANYSHNQGYGNIIGPLGTYASVSGRMNRANGMNSTVFGRANTAHYRQTIFGTYAKNDSTSDTLGFIGQLLFKIGNGTSDTTHKDIFTVSDSGNVVVAGSIMATNIFPYYDDTYTLGSARHSFSIVYTQIVIPRNGGTSLSLGTNVDVASISIGGPTQTGATIVLGGSSTVSSNLTLSAYSNDLLYKSDSTYSITLPTTFVSKKEQTICNTLPYSLIIPSTVTLYGNGVSYNNTTKTVALDQVIKLIQISTTVWFISTSTLL